MAVRQSSSLWDLETCTQIDISDAHKSINKDTTAYRTPLKGCRHSHSSLCHFELVVSKKPSRVLEQARRRWRNKLNDASVLRRDVWFPHPHQALFGLAEPVHVIRDDDFLFSRMFGQDDCVGLDCFDFKSVGGDPATI